MSSTLLNTVRNSNTIQCSCDRHKRVDKGQQWVRPGMGGNVFEIVTTLTTRQCGCSSWHGKAWLIRYHRTTRRAMEDAGTHTHRTNADTSAEVDMTGLKG